MKTLISGIFTIIALWLALLAGTAAAAEPVAADTRSLEQELEKARKELNEAARKVAELSARLGAQGVHSEVFMVSEGNRAVLGVAIDDKSDLKEGVKIIGVSPGGPAAEAGLASGDVILALNGNVLKPEGGRSAAQYLRQLMAEVKPGDTVTVRYRRGDKIQEAKVKTEAFTPFLFAFGRGDDDKHDAFALAVPPRHPKTPFFFHFAREWGDLELAALTPRLGEYFGTSEGVLVVRASRDPALKLEDGDVILRIGDRVPTSPEHAMRILHSYNAGETLRLEIMRDRKRQTVTVTVPERRVGGIFDAWPGTNIELEREIRVETAK
ncbi:MAG TPA: PDZ domain-containing protein [Gammaproteobacteria bacterium]|nr:PDZ domain-containing protein [Gammaproteobacteria bacterium]